jgi:hypothetical protein
MFLLVDSIAGTLTHQQYHQEFKPPPEGSITGLNKTEVIEEVRDPSNDMEQIQHRITVFEEHFDKVRHFYETYSELMVMSAEANDEQLVANELESHIDTFVKLREQKRQEELELKRQQELLAQQQLEREREEELARKLAEEAAAQAEAERVSSRRMLCGCYVIFIYCVPM